MARVIGLVNQKGGVGKSTTAVNLGAYLAVLGRRTLLIDFDPQANASSALGHGPLKTTDSIYHGIFGHKDPYGLIVPSPLYNFHLIPSAPHLAGAMIELVDKPEREYFLRKFLNFIRHHYDYVIIDMPPSLSLLTVNGLVASDEILIPVQAEYYSLEGIGQLLETIDLIKNNLGHNLKVAGAVVTMYDEGEKLNRDVARNLREYFPHTVFVTQIPRHSALAEAPSFSKPVVLYAPASPGAKAYRRLAEELIEQEKKLFAPPEIYAGNEFGNFNV